MGKRSVGGKFSFRRLMLFILFLGICFLVWDYFFNYENCSNKECFDEYLKNCNRATYVGGDDMIFRYTIEGDRGDSCFVDVELLQGEISNADSLKLEGQSMICELPLGVVVSPESDIGVCHGLLKEGLQDLVIRKLHSYLIQNLGRLNFEMADLPATD